LPGARERNRFSDAGDRTVVDQSVEVAAECNRRTAALDVVEIVQDVRVAGQVDGAAAGAEDRPVILDPIAAREPADRQRVPADQTVVQHDMITSAQPKRAEDAIQGPEIRQRVSVSVQRHRREAGDRASVDEGIDAGQGHGCAAAANLPGFSMRLPPALSIASAPALIRP
jgi:hypothetical protein